MLPLPSGITPECSWDDGARVRRGRRHNEDASLREELTGAGRGPGVGRALVGVPTG